MALKQFNPTTPSLRQLVLVDRSELYKGKPVKALTHGKSEAGGRLTEVTISGAQKLEYFQRVLDEVLKSP